ncbi:MAG: hypothetical protein U9R79_18250 [Armatimonadota bacterium]|nr:hypothetical protein [Armatimonadota bacterium]
MLRSPLQRRAAWLVLPAVLLLYLRPAHAQNPAAIPESWTATSITSCEDASRFSAGRTPDRPQFLFDAWELSTTAGARVEGESLRWHLVPSSPQQTEARLTWSRSLAAPAGAISLWLKNPNGHRLGLRLEMVDADGARYLSEEVPLAGDLGWRQIAFRLEDLVCQPPGDPWPGPDFPVVMLSLLLGPLEAGRPYTLYIDEIEAHRPQRGELRVVSLSVPTSLAPGETVPVRARLAAEEEAAGRARVEAHLAAESGGALVICRLSSRDAAGGELEATGALEVPAWLPPGRYQIRLHSDGAALADARPTRTVVGGRPPEPVKAAIDASTSPPAIVVNGRTLRPLVHELRGAPAVSLPSDAALVALPATADAHPFGWAPDADGGYGGLDRRAASVLAAAGEDALVLLQVFLDSSSSWDETHPNQLVRFGGETVAPTDSFGRKRTLPDLMAPAWQADALRRLRALVEHVEAAPWGHRVAGYELLAGDVGAWRPWGASLGLGDEATPVREEAFRAWVMQRYSNVEEFRDAWVGQRRGAPVTPGPSLPGFEAVRVPPPLPDAPEPSLYDPAIDRPMIDLLHFHAEAPVALLREMAAALRELAPGKLVGAPYGHLMQQSAEGHWRWPHLAVSEIIDDGTLDFLTGPLWSPAGPVVPTLPAQAARRGGVLCLERASGDAGLRAAAALVSGAGLAADAGAVARLGRLASEVGRPRGVEPVVDVLFVVDERGARYLSGADGLPGALLADQQRLLARSGLSWRRCLLSEVIAGRAPRARVYIFADLLTAEPEDGRALARFAFREGAMLIFIYGPGAVAEQRITGRTMKYLTGIKLTLLPPRGPLRVAVDAADALPGVGAEGLSYGLGSGAPRFFSADERAEWLGTLAGTEFCGLALLRFPHCTSVFSAAPLLPPEVLRGLAARVDVAPQADTDARAWFGPDLMVLEGAEQPRRVTLPEPATVTDLRSGEVVAREATEIALDVADGDVGVFRLGSQ